MYNLGIKTENFKQICKNNCVVRIFFLKMKKRAQLKESFNEKYLGSCKEKVIWTEYLTSSKRIR